MDKQLPQYSGPLKPHLIAWGMSLAIVQAKRLTFDAMLLLKHKRYSSAVGLALLAIEEAGKVGILRGLSTANTPKEIEDCWRSYRSHVRKNAVGGIGFFANSNRPLKLADLEPMFAKGAPHTYQLNNIKQLAFYTDCLGKGNWWSPDHEFMNEKAAKAMVNFAKVLVSDSKLVYPKEVELWQQHMTGVSESTDQAEVLRAFEGFLEGMQEAGLEGPSYEAMRRFIVDGLDLQPPQPPV